MKKNRFAVEKGWTFSSYLALVLTSLLLLSSCSPKIAQVSPEESMDLSARSTHSDTRTADKKREEAVPDRLSGVTDPSGSQKPPTEFDHAATPFSAPKVRYTVKPLDLSRPPSTEELMAAGQLGGLLYPTEDVETDAAKILEVGITEEEIKRNQAINLSFGEAIQEWNKHNYKKAVELFKEHLTDYPDSPWASEAVLHIGCDATYNGRYSEANESFRWIIEKNEVSGYYGARMLVNKAKLRLGNLKVLQGNFVEAMNYFKALKEEGSDWRDRTYAAYWIQRISKYKKEELAMLNCGVQALAYLLEKDGREAEAREVMQILPTSHKGQSIGDLKSISAGYGYHLTGLTISVAELQKIPLPAIIQLSGQNEGDRGHYWIVEKWSEESLSFFDPQSGRRFQQRPDEFSREWSGNILTFMDTGEEENLPGVMLSEQAMGEFYGGCCGSPAPEDDCGEPCRKARASRGFPTWSVNMISMNVFVTDIPLWYESPIGPPVEITLSYNSQSGIAHHEPFGNKWQFNYGSYLIVDTAGNVTVFMPDGRRDTFIPDGGGGYLHPYKVYNKLTRIAENHFELRFQDDTVYVYRIPSGTTSLQSFLTEIRDPYGQHLTFTYNPNVQLTAITDAMGRNTSLAYNAAGLVTQINDPFGRSTTFQYDANRNLTRIIDMGGYGSNFSYDEDIYLTGIEDAKGKTVFYIEPADGIPANSDNYPPPGDEMWENYRVTVTDPLGGKEEYMYYAGCAVDEDLFSEMENSCRGYSWYVSPRDYIVWQSEEINNFRKQTPKTRYLFSLIPSGLREEVGTVLFPEGGKIKYAYDAAGNPISATDFHGHTFQYTYNAMGLMTSITDQKGNVTDLTYAANGVDLLTIQDGRGTKTYGYNDKHDVTSITDRLGHTTSLTYNSFGQISSRTDALGVVTGFTYDPNQRLQQITKDGKTLESFTYDAVDRVRTYTDPTGLALTFDYNNLNDVTKVTYPDGKFETLTYTSCCPHLKESVTDRAGRTTGYTYDPLKRLTGTMTPEGGITRFYYDANSNMVRLMDPNGRGTVFEYDKDNRFIKRTYADGRSVSLTYDETGLLTTRTNARGISSNYTYDANHNLLTTSYTDGTPGVTYQYDDFNRVTQRQDGIGTFQYAYDANSRLLSMDGPWVNDTITYQYDALDEITSLSQQGGQAASYTFDALNRLTGLQLGTDTYAYTYTASNPLVQNLSRPNGSFTAYQYDALNRLTMMSNKNSASEIINQYVYTYNQEDLRSSETITNGNPITSFQNEQISYDYNEVNQLLNSTDPDKAFVYDDDGNMTQGYTPEGYLFTASFDAENQIKSLEYPDGASQIHRTDYFYGGNNFLAEIKEYQDNSLIGDTRFVRSGLLVLQERDAGNNVLKEYSWGLNMGGGIGGLLNLRQNGLDYAYLYDGKGNVGALIDDSQVPVAAYTYDTFGNLMSKTGTLNQPMQFSTKAYDEQTGLSYYGYRFYSPVLSRWITRDLIEEAGGLNLYGFAGINPVNRIDFFGLDDAAIQSLQSQMDARANAFKNLVNNPDFKYPGLSPRGPLGVPGYVWRAGKLVKACYDAAEEVEKAKKEAEEKQKKEQAEKEFKKLLREKFGIEYVSAGASSGGP